MAAESSPDVGSDEVVRPAPGGSDYNTENAEFPVAQVSPGTRISSNADATDETEVQIEFSVVLNLHVNPFSSVSSVLERSVSR